MTFEVNLDISAVQDIDEIFKWYEKQREGLEFEFLLSFDDSLDLLAKNPYAYFNVTRTIRRIAITRFPYTAYYSIDLNTITIHVIMHQHRDPEEWQMRI